MKNLLLQNLIRKQLLTTLVVLFVSNLFAQDIIHLYAGDGTGAFAGDGGTALSAQVRLPSDIFIDASGNKYIADANNHCIRKVTGGGTISTVVGTGGTSGFAGDGGLATAARLNQPGAVCLDNTGNMYIADATNHRIRKVDAATGIISTIAGNGTASTTGDGGLATAATINFPYGIAIDNNGDIYFSESSSHVIRKITVSTGIISTYAGTIGTAGSSGDGGAATSARLNFPRDICFDGAYNLYIADRVNNKIRKVTASTGNISTIAGTGTAGSTGDGGLATAARLRGPFGVSVDATGNIFIADATNNKIRKVNGVTGIITTFAGTGTSGYSGDGGDATLANLNFPTNVFADASYLYVVDNSNNRIRRIQIGPIILPLGFQDFTATVVEKKQVDLNWNSFSEEANSTYILERSLNGLHWEFISDNEINENSTNLHHYSSIDYTPYSGISYYRLSKENLNGEKFILSIQSVNIEFSFTVYPNPVNGESISILFPSDLSNTTIIEWIDVSGKIVKRDEIFMSHNEHSISFNLQDLQNGSYMLRMTDDKGGSTQEKVVVLR